MFVLVFHSFAICEKYQVTLQLLGLVKMIARVTGDSENHRTS